MVAGTAASTPLDRDAVVAETPAPAEPLVTQKLATPEHKVAQ
jgi:hypothetical protein